VGKPAPETMEAFLDSEQEALHREAMGHKPAKRQFMPYRRPELRTTLEDIEEACGVALTLGWTPEQIGRALRAGGVEWKDRKILYCREDVRPVLMMELTRDLRLGNIEFERRRKK
jgi:hypothetical protein